MKAPIPNFKIFISLVFFATFIAYPHFSVKNIADTLSDENSIEMYGLSYCGKCTHMKRQLRSAGIPFDEIQLDEWTPQEQGELFTKVSSNTNNNSGGIPFFNVNGTWIAHTGIEISDIKEELIYK